MLICMVHFRIMARIRGGSSQPKIRERPTASVRRGDRSDGAGPAIVQNIPPVSYTHLTLPTKRIV